jgi:hypothetical protein
MSLYTLLPVHHVGITLEPCTEDERELYGIYCENEPHVWIADFSPNHKQLAADVCAYLNNRARIIGALDLVTLHVDTKE